MPLYQCEKTLPQAIESVWRQQFSEWELLLIDDASTDNSRSIAQEWCAKDERIHLIGLEKNQGVSDARNRGISIARGRYIAFLDSDDWWHEDKLEKQVAVMRQHHAVISYTGYIRYEERKEKKLEMRVPETVNYQQLLKSNWMGCLTVIYDQKRLGKRFFVSQRFSEDWTLWLSILKEGYTAIGVCESLATYRVQKKSRSSSKWRVVLFQWQLYRKKEKLGLGPACFYFTVYLLLGILRTRCQRRGN